MKYFTIVLFQILSIITFSQNTVKEPLPNFDELIPSVDDIDKDIINNTEEYRLNQIKEKAIYMALNPSIVDSVKPELTMMPSGLAVKPTIGEREIDINDSHTLINDKYYAKSKTYLAGYDNVAYDKRIKDNEEWRILKAFMIVIGFILVVFLISSKLIRSFTKKEVVYSDDFQKEESFPIRKTFISKEIKKKSKKNKKKLKKLKKEIIFELKESLKKNSTDSVLKNQDVKKINLEITFTRWKDLGSIFYTKEIYRVVIYDDNTILLVNPVGLPIFLDIVSTHQQGQKYSFGVLHRKQRIPGSLVLSGNTMILVWEGMNGIKLKM